MSRTLLNKHWTKLKPILLDLGFYDKQNLTLTFEDVLFCPRTSCQSHDIPAYFGKRNTLYRHFRYWVKTGKLDRLFKRLMIEPDWVWLFIDGIYIRGHQHGTGIADQAIGKTKGGSTTKIHLVVEAKGHPVNIEITEGTTAEVQMVRLCLAATQQGEVVCADKGDDADALREGISRFGG